MPPGQRWNHPTAPAPGPRAAAAPAQRVEPDVPRTDAPPWDDHAGVVVPFPGRSADRPTPAAATSGDAAAPPVHRVSLIGELRCRTAGSDDDGAPERLQVDMIGLSAGRADVELLRARRTLDDVEVEVEVLGCVQPDLALTVVVVLAHRAGSGEEQLEATTTVARAGTAVGFDVILHPSSGGEVRASGSVENRVLR